MKKHKKSFSSNMIVGINGVLNVLKAKKLEIISVHIMIDSNADKNQSISQCIRKIKNKTQRIPKKEFLNKYPKLRTQGVVVHFRGKIYQEIKDFSKESSDYSLLILDNIEDPQNFGQIIRTVECAGINGIIFSKHHSAPLTNTVLEVSQGAFVNMNFFEVTNIRNELKTLKNNNFWTIGLENSIDAKPWYSIEYSGKTVIVVGSEGKGIRKKVLETCDFISTIPMQGKTNSLNVGAATAAIVFERLRQKLEKK